MGATGHLCVTLGIQGAQRVAWLMAGGARFANDGPQEVAVSICFPALIGGVGQLLFLVMLAVPAARQVFQGHQFYPA